METRFFQHLFHAGIILFLSRMANSILSIYILMIDLLTLSLVAIAVKRVDYMRAENINSKWGYLRVALFHVVLIGINASISFYYTHYHTSVEGMKYFFALEHFIQLVELSWSLIIILVILFDLSCCNRRVWEGRNNFLSILELLAEVSLLSLTLI